MKKLMCIISFLFLASFSWGNTSSGSTISSTFDQYSNGCSTAASTSYSNTAVIGQSAVGNSSSLSYKNYAGFLSAFVIIVDVVINFMDETPSSSDWQDTPNVTCKITVESSAGNTVSSVKYRLSKAGADEGNFLTWQSDASIDTTHSANKLTYKIAVTTPSFADTENNFIQWRARNSGGLESFSAKYRVRVSTNEAPTITIIQPDEKGGYAAMLPQIEAKIEDRSYGVDPNSIQIKLDDSNSVNVSLTNVSDIPSVFTLNGSSGTLSYKYDKRALTPETTYKLTITASDKSGKTGSSSVTFKAKAGAISDVVPYPSPFDPKIQPIKIRYILDKPSEVSVNIYDMSGRLVKTVTDNQMKSAGVNEDSWSGSNFANEDLANGVYFCEVTAKDSDGDHRRYTTLAIFGK